MQTDDDKKLLPWKQYLTITIESLLSFYLATFCMTMFYIHHGPDWIATGIFLCLSYIFVIFVCVKRVFEHLPLPALMIVIPIAPLIALIMIISFIPLLQNLVL